MLCLYDDSMSCVQETEALLCMLVCVQTTHNTYTLFVYKSLYVFDIFEHVLQENVVWLKLFIGRILVYQMRPVVTQFFFCVMFCWYKIKPSRFKMSQIFEKSKTSCEICCHASCDVLSELYSKLSQKTVQQDKLLCMHSLRSFLR